MPIEAHPPAATIDRSVVERFEPVNDPLGCMGARHRLESRQYLRGSGTVASGKACKHHRLVAGKEIPCVDEIDASPPSQKANYQSSIAFLCKLLNHGIIGPAR